MKRPAKGQRRKTSTKRVLRRPDIRRFPRADVEWNVTAEVPGRRPQKGKLSGLNPFGAKLHLRAKQSAAPEGTTLQIQFAPPDGEPPMDIKGLVWRNDRDGQAIVFVNLGGGDFLRLKKLVPVAAAPRR